MRLWFKFWPFLLLLPFTAAFPETLQLAGTVRSCLKSEHVFLEKEESYSLQIQSNSSLPKKISLQNKTGQVLKNVPFLKNQLSNSIRLKLDRPLKKESFLVIEAH